MKMDWKIAKMELRKAAKAEKMEETREEKESIIDGILARI